MKEQSLAIKLFKSKKSGVDPILNLLENFEELSGEISIDKVVKTYRDLLEGNVLLASVTSRLELDEEAKTNIKNKVSKKFDEDEILFDFIIDKKASSTLEIFVGDHILKI